MTEERLDVVVLGAGPAGSTCAHLLAKGGAKVRVLEKERFPRFHVGESLLPCENAIFERLGFDIGGGDYLYKAGAEFIDERTDDIADYPFAGGLPGTPSHAYHVERARFDHELAQLAANAGAEIRFGVKVRNVDVSADEVTISAEDGEHRARFVIDATGQDAFLARRRKSIRPIKDFGVVAAFAQFSELSPESVAELTETGNIKILIHDDGWAWLIPLTGGRLSFGVVSRRGGLGTGMIDAVQSKSKLIARLTRGAKRADPQLVRHFGYVNAEPYGARYACIGDSAAFLDPVFSSGIFLGMKSAEMAADILGPALSDGTEARPDLLDPVKAKMREAYVAFGSLIRSFYSTNLVKHFFFHPDPEPELRAGLTSILAGDVFREDNKFQNSITKGRRLWTPESVAQEELGARSPRGR